jgi:hypothetical protein
METITFACAACKHVMKVGADKAGRKSKCPKCGAPVEVPSATGAGDEEAIQEPRLAPLTPGPDGPAAGEKPAPTPAADDEIDGGPMTYDLKDAAETGRTVFTPRAKFITPEGPGRRKGKRLAKITHAKQWVRVGLGLQLVAAGMLVWLAAYLLYRVPLVLGLAVGEEYAAQADLDRLVQSPPEYPGAPSLNYCTYAVTLISGNFWGTFMLWLVRFSQVIYLLMYFLLVTGYVLCLAAPQRYGTRLQLGVLLALAAGNAFFGIFFRLLPMMGLYEYTILPIAVPEVVLVEMNSERIESIYTFWLHVPMLELYWALLLNMMFFLEPAMVGVFLRAVAKGIKSDDLEEKAMRIMKMGFSQLYVQLAFMLVALCGTSAVLLMVLRFVYAIGMGFFIGQLIYTAVVCFTVPGIVLNQLGDQAQELLEKEDEPVTKQEEEEEEEEDERPAKVARAAADDDEDEED